MEDSIYRLRHRDILTLCVLALLFLGVVMVQSAAMNVTGDVRWQWTQRGMRHLVYAMVAVVAFFVVGNIDYAWLGRRTALWRNPILWLGFVAGFTSLIVLIRTSVSR
jgi:cell division protein FtsW (lipid II flippase)